MRRTGCIVLLIVVCVVGVFGRLTFHELSGWDDNVTISENPNFNPPTLPKLAWYWTAMGQNAPTGLYIPLTYTFWGALAKIAYLSTPNEQGIHLNPYVYHGANVVLHVLSALVVFAVLRPLVANDWAAGAGALLWALHPVQVEPVGWASGGKDVLCGLLSLVAIWQYLQFARGRHPGRAYILATIAFIGAMLSKPTAVVVPIIALVLDIWGLHRPPARAMASLTAWFVLVIPCVVWTKASHSTAGVPVVEWWLRPLIATDALAFYLRKIIVPTGHGVDYGYRPPTRVQEGWIWFTWIAPAAIAVLMLRMRQRAPLLLAGGLVFVAGLLPVLGFLPFQFQYFSTVADHYLYLPLLGVALAGAWVVARFPTREMAIASVSILLAMAVQSFRTGANWKDDPAIFSNAIQVNPRSFVAHNNLGSSLFTRYGKVAEAERHFRRAIEIFPQYATAYDNLARVLLRSGRDAEALEALNRALAIDPRHPLALYRRGHLKLYARGDADGAIADLTAVRDLAPTLIEPRITLANAYKAKGNLDSGIRELEAIVQQMPAERTARLTLLEFYRMAAPPRWSDYQRVLSESRQISEFADDAAFMLAEVSMWSDLGDLSRALQSSRQAVQAAPNDPRVLRAYFDVTLRSGQYPETIAVADRVLTAQQQLWWVWQARAIAKSHLNNKEGALLDFEKALTIAADQQDDAAAWEILTNMAHEVGGAAAMQRVEPKARTDRRWRMLAAQLCRAQGDFENGLKWTSIMLDDPRTQGAERDMVMGLAGEFYYSKHPADFEKATEMFKKIVDNNPQDPRALNNLAAIMTMPGSGGKPEDALPHSQRAYDIMLQSGIVIPEVLDTHGWILVQVGRIDEGIALLLQAVQQKPMPEAYFHLGAAYLMQNIPYKADQAFQQAMELIRRAEKDGIRLDPTLKTRIEEGLARSAAMVEQKSSTGEGAK